MTRQKTIDNIRIQEAAFEDYNPVCNTAKVSNDRLCLYYEIDPAFGRHDDDLFNITFGVHLNTETGEVEEDWFSTDGVPVEDWMIEQNYPKWRELIDAAWNYLLSA